MFYSQPKRKFPFSCLSNIERKRRKLDYSILHNELFGGLVSACGGSLKTRYSTFCSHFSIFDSQTQTLNRKRKYCEEENKSFYDLGDPAVSGISSQRDHSGLTQDENTSDIFAMKRGKHKKQKSHQRPNTLSYHQGHVKMVDSSSDSTEQVWSISIGYMVVYGSFWEIQINFTHHRDDRTLVSVNKIIILKQLYWLLIIYRM